MINANTVLPTAENVPLSSGSVNESLWTGPAVGQCKCNCFHWGVLCGPGVMLQLNLMENQFCLFIIWKEQIIGC